MIASPGMASRSDRTVRSRSAPHRGAPPRHCPARSSSQSFAWRCSSLHAWFGISFSTYPRGDFSHRAAQGWRRAAPDDGRMPAARSQQRRSGDGAIEGGGGARIARCAVATSPITARRRSSPCGCSGSSAAHALQVQHQHLISAVLLRSGSASGGTGPDRTTAGPGAAPGGWPARGQRPPIARPRS